MSNVTSEINVKQPPRAANIIDKFTEWSLNWVPRLHGVCTCVDGDRICHGPVPDKLRYLRSDQFLCRKLLDAAYLCHAALHIDDYRLRDCRFQAGQAFHRRGGGQAENARRIHCLVLPGWRRRRLDSLGCRTHVLHGHGPGTCCPQAWPRHPLPVHRRFDLRPGQRHVQRPVTVGAAGGCDPREFHGENDRGHPAHANRAVAVPAFASALHVLDHSCLGGPPPAQEGQFGRNGRRDL